MPQHILLFLLAALTINILPGPDMLYVISQSMGHGKRFGIAAALGIGSGCFVHIFAVTVGLAALLLKSALTFTIIKYLGACYLLYLGIISLRKKESILKDDRNMIKRVSSWRKSYLQGFVTNVLNPKVALFFLAFLPQFVIPSSHHSIGFQVFILGLIFNCSGTIVNILVACFFNVEKKWISSNPLVLKIQPKLTGLILIGLGLRIAVLEK